MSPKQTQIHNHLRETARFVYVTTALFDLFSSDIGTCDVCILRQNIEFVPKIQYIQT